MTVWPLVKYAVIAAAAVLLAQAVAGRVARPIGLLNTEYREKQRVAAELESLKKENELLQRRIKYLQTPRGAAQAARRLGYVKPGEITLVLPPEPPKASSARERGQR
jgi:cell division protein FtsB